MVQGVHAGKGGDCLDQPTSVNVDGQPAQVSVPSFANWLRCTPPRACDAGVEYKTAQVSPGVTDVQPLQPKTCRIDRPTALAPASVAASLNVSAVAGHAVACPDVQPLQPNKRPGRDRRAHTRGFGTAPAICRHCLGYFPITKRRSWRTRAALGHAFVTTGAEGRRWQACR